MSESLPWLQTLLTEDDHEARNLIRSTAALNMHATYEAIQCAFQPEGGPQRLKESIKKMIELKTPEDSGYSQESEKIDAQTQKKNLQALTQRARAAGAR